MAKKDLTMGLGCTECSWWSDHLNAASCPLCGGKIVPCAKEGVHKVRKDNDKKHGIR